MKKISLLLLLISAFGFLAEAQVQQPRRTNTRGGQTIWMHPNHFRRPTLSMGLEVAAPINQFADNFDGVPVGLGAQFLTNASRRSPFEFGLGFSWLSQGSSKKDIWIYEGVDIDGVAVFSRGTIAVNSNIYTYNGIVRFKPLLGVVQPYIDGLAGMRNFSTSTVVQSNEDGSEREKDRATRDFALTYGWAAGVKVRVTPTLMVEGRFSNLYGTAVSFVDRNTLDISDEGEITFEETSTRTDMYIFHVGVCFEF